MQDDRLREALEATDPSRRLRAALDAGTRARPGDAAVLVARCARETDFFVRDMLTWALTRHPADRTVPLLVAELDSPVSQARSQALHTLSKIRDASAWPHLTEDLLRDADTDVARAAWRAAVALVPAGREEWLADVLVSQLGRGDTEVQKSLSRALLALDDVAEAAGPDDGGPPPAWVAALARATDSPRAVARAHAQATLRLRDDPDAGFAGALEEAKRVVALGRQGAGG